MIVGNTYDIHKGDKYELHKGDVYELIWPVGGTCRKKIEPATEEFVTEQKDAVIAQLQQEKKIN